MAKAKEIVLSGEDKKAAEELFNSILLQEQINKLSGFHIPEDTMVDKFKRMIDDKVK